MCNYKYKVLVPKYFVSEKDGVEQRFSTTARFHLGLESSLVAGSCPAHCPMFNSIPSLHLLDASRNPQV